MLNRVDEFVGLRTEMVMKPMNKGSCIGTVTKFVKL
jgi:hypothetical protein